MDTMTHKNIFKLAWPAIVQEAMGVVVSYVDTAMVGSLGALASAAVGLTSSVNWFIGSVCVAFGVGTLAVISQSVGAKNDEKVKKVGQQALFITAACGIVFTIVALLFAPYIPRFFGADESLWRISTEYFIIISLPMIFRSVLCVLSSTLRGVGDMKTPMVIQIGMNILNIILNVLLIYPTRQIGSMTIFGFGLGINGAAIGTALSYSVGGLALLIIYLRHPLFCFKETGIHYAHKEMKECLRVGIPVALERGVICLGHMTFTSFISRLGVIPLAAHTIAIQAEQAFYIPGYGFQSACATLSGFASGEKDVEKVKLINRLITKIAVFIMTIGSVLLFIFAKELMSFFTPDHNVITIGATVLRLVALSEPIYGCLIIIEGTFNGLGETKAPFVISTLTMWGIRILGTAIIVFVLQGTLFQVWLFMVADNVMRFILLWIIFKKGMWEKRIVNRKNIS